MQEVDCCYKCDNAFNHLFYLQGTVNLLKNFRFYFKEKVKG